MPDAPTPTPPFGDALVEAVKRITDQLLLFVLAGAIIVVGAAVAGPPGSRAVVLPVLLLLVLGMILWTALQTRRVQRGQEVILRAVRLRPFAVVEGGVEHGRIRKRGPGRGQRLHVDQRTHLSPGARIGGSIKYGDVDLGGTGDRHTAADGPPPDDAPWGDGAARP